jgi:hypothetical protein
MTGEVQRQKRCATFAISCRFGASQAGGEIHGTKRSGGTPAETLREALTGRITDDLENRVTSRDTSGRLDDGTKSESTRARRIGALMATVMTQEETAG